MKAGHSKLGDYFVSSRAKGREGLPLMSVTLNNGLVVRDSLDRRTTTSLDPSEHLLVKEGDIAYNMMRVWQGALGRASSDGLVSPAYVVLRPRDGVDSKYAEYLFKTPRMIYLFWAYSYGLTKDRLRLYPNDFKKIPANMPRLCVQEKVSEILSKWDESIDVVGELIETEKTRKQALMQQLLTGNIRLPEFEGEWVERRLESVADVLVSPVNKKTSSKEAPVRLCNYTDVYYNSKITNKIDFMMATAKLSEVEKFSLVKGDVVITKDSENPGDIAIPAVVSEDLENVVCGYHLAIIRPIESRADGEFLSFLFSLSEIRRYFFTLANGATRFGLSINSIKGSLFNMPGIKEQKAIAKVLSVADAEIETLQQRLDCLRQEKRALMQQLLTGKRRVKVEEEAVA